MEPATRTDGGAFGIWAYRVDLQLSTDDLVGYEVEATDGRIGKIDEATNKIGGSYVVVDTGPWILGKHVMLPAGVISEIDVGNRIVYVGRSKQEIKDAPEFAGPHGTPEYRSGLADYYHASTSEHEAELEADRLRKTG